jgi:serine/threonine protein phosphatase PrpC
MEKWPVLGRMFGKKEEERAKKEGKEEKLEIVCAYATEASERHPKRNGDSFFIDKENSSAGVFDGMSRPYGDNLASSACAEYVKSKIGEVRDEISAEKAERIFEEIIEGADSFVGEPERYKEERDLYQSIGGDMDKVPGTTATFIKIHKDAEKENWLIVGHVGNSRLYKIEENGTLTQLTEDNDILEVYYEDDTQRTQVSRKFSNIKTDEGLDETEKLAFKEKNQLTKAIGCGIVNGSTMSIKLNRGDRFLLLTDGILNLTTDEIEKTIKESKNPDKIVKNLIAGALKVSREGKKVNKRSSPDDMTAIVVEIK